MDDRAVAQGLEVLGASVAALAVALCPAGFVSGHDDGTGDGHVVAAGADPQAGVDPGSGADPRSGADFGDPLRDQADAYLDGLAGLARVEAQVAALKVQLAAGYAAVAEAPGGAGLFCAAAHGPADGGDR